MNYFPDFIPVHLQKLYFNQLLAQLNWRQDEIVIYGKRVSIPRLQAWYGEHNYTYSGLTLKSQLWLPVLTDLKLLVEQKAKQPFNVLLANYYRDQNDTVGWHSDDEPELGKYPVIASLSFGEERNFQFKHKLTGEKLSLPLKSGSLLVMSGETQAYWQHCLPRTKKQKLARINLTFRKICLV